jgi:DNA primase
MKIKKATLETVKAIPISAVLESEGIRLKRVGREYLTKCPWHNDTNPSLTINDDKNICFCFVCKGGSDAIAFIQQKLGLSFSEAVERIAQKHSIEFLIEDENPEVTRRERLKRQLVIDELQKAQEAFRQNLKDPKAARIRQILLDRNVSPETAREFGIGFANAGFFASRITVPIYDHVGSLVGFSARATLLDQTPKYKNSSASDIFDKSKLVFNEHRALPAIREADSVIFVEGHFDVISMHQAGIRNVVAMQGTGAPDINVIKRLASRTKRFILCYDSDDGGMKATEQFLKIAGPMACRGELTITVASMPQGTDPDQCINDPSIDLYGIIANAPPWLDWQLDVWLKNLDRSDTHRFSLIEKAIRDLIQSIQSPALRQFYIDKASKNLVNDAKSARELAVQWAEAIPRTSTKRRWERPTPSQTRLIAEKRLIRLYIHAPELRTYCLPLFDRIQSPVYRWLANRISEIEETSAELNSDNIMAILLSAEPHYLRQLRPVAMPTIKIEKSGGVLRHIEDTLCKEIILSDDYSNQD